MKFLESFYTRDPFSKEIKLYGLSDMAQIIELAFKRFIINNDMESLKKMDTQYDLKNYLKNEEDFPPNTFKDILEPSILQDNKKMFDYLLDLDIINIEDSAGAYNTLYRYFIKCLESNKPYYIKKLDDKFTSIFRECINEKVNVIRLVDNITNNYDKEEYWDILDLIVMIFSPRNLEPFVKLLFKHAHDFDILGVLQYLIENKETYKYVENLLDHSGTTDHLKYIYLYRQDIEEIAGQIEINRNKQESDAGYYDYVSNWRLELFKPEGVELNDENLEEIAKSVKEYRSFEGVTKVNVFDQNNDLLKYEMVQWVLHIEFE